MRSFSCQFAIHAPNLPGDLRQVLENARLIGVTGLEIPAVSSLIDITTLSISGQREVRHTFASHNQSIVSIRIELSAKGFAHGEDIDKILDRLDKIMASSVSIGCARLSIDLGRLPPVQRLPKLKQKIDSELAGLLIIPTIATTEEAEPEIPLTRIDPSIMQQWQHAMTELGSIADRYGIVLAFSSILSSLAAVAQLIDNVRCPWFGAELNTVCALNDEWSLDEIFNRLTRVLSTVRAKDAIKGEQNRTRPAIIGTGDVQWQDILNHLEESNYTGPIILDPTDLPNTPQAISKGLSYFEQLQLGS